MLDGKERDRIYRVLEDLERYAVIAHGDHPIAPSVTHNAYLVGRPSLPAGPAASRVRPVPFLRAPPAG